MWDVNTAAFSITFELKLIHITLCRCLGPADLRWLHQSEVPIWLIKAYEEKRRKADAHSTAARAVASAKDAAARARDAVAKAKAEGESSNRRLRVLAA